MEPDLPESHIELHGNFVVIGMQLTLRFGQILEHALQFLCECLQIHGQLTSSFMPVALHSLALAPGRALLNLSSHCL